ncbi:ABC transporter A family member 1 [Diplonema papillatum]|nr:ABC transporter A family member 1 [Diplonema papillatum]
MEASPPPARKQLGTLPAAWLVARKNLTLKLRQKRQTFCELFLPTLFIASLLPNYWAVGTKTYGDETFTLPNATFVNFTDEFAHMKCTLDPVALPEYAPCDGEMPAHDCLGHLCIKLPSDDDAELIRLLSNFTNPRSSTIPDYDTVALVRRFAKTKTLPGTSTFGISVVNAVSTGFHVIVVPGNADAEARVLADSLEDYLTLHTYTHQFVSLSRNFTSEDEALEFAKSDAGSTRVWAVVTVHSQTEFYIQMNRTATPSTSEGRSPDMGFDTQYQLYQSGGFVTIQSLVSEWILEQSGFDFPPGVFSRNMEVLPMPIAAYTENAFLKGAAGGIPLVFLIALLYPVAQMVAAIVREKESRVREGMLIMGLPLPAFQLSWIMTTWTMMTLAAVPIVLIFTTIMLSGTPFFLQLPLYWLYGLSLGSFSIFLSVLFSSSSACVIVAPMVFFATSLPSNILDPDDTSSGVSQLLSILPNYAFARGFGMLGEAEGQGTPLNFNSAGDGSYSFYSSVAWLAVDTVVYLLLAWYLDNVLPSEWGTHKPFYFCFDPAYWTSGKYGYPGRDRQKMKYMDSLFWAEKQCDLIEDITDSSMVGTETVAVRNIRKEFVVNGNRRVANDDVSLRMYEGQILALLGHNGAGKTTLINMLTGMLPPSAGNATIYGDSIVTSTSRARSTIGLCPQHNILWDNLTCFEHLVFYGALKGVPAKNLREQVLSMLEQVGLSDKESVYSEALSGGMKRKLSVGIALMGDSKFVILDEPTAGMDVQARRQIWDLLKRARTNRTVLLTTHFMSEADLLGDSIAIMTAGKLYCHGSSFFLKQKLGIGYNLRAEFAPEADGIATRATSLKRVIEKHLGTSPDGESHCAELLATAGNEATYRLPMWAVARFGDLFEAMELTEGTADGVKNFGISVTTLEEIFIKVAQDAGNPAGAAPPNEATPLLLEPEEADIKCVNMEPWERLRGQKLAKSQWQGLLYKRMRYSMRDKKTICFQIVIPVLIVLLTLALAEASNFTGLPAIDVYRYDQASQVSIAPAAGSPWLGTYPREFDLDVYGIPASDVLRNDTELAPVLGMDRYLLSTANTRGRKDYRWESVVQRDFNAPDAVNEVFAVFHNTTSYHSIPITLAHLTTAVLRLEQSDPLVRVVNRPLPFSEYTKNSFSGMMAIAVGVTLLVPFAFIPANFISFIVKEREVKAKHVQLVSGVRLTAYWAANFAFDLMSFSVSTMLCVLLFVAFGRDEYVGSFSTFCAFLLLFFFFGLSATASTYLASFRFTSPSTAQNAVMAVNFLTGFVAVLVVFFLKVFSSTEDVGEGLRFVFRLVPCYCLGDGLVAMAQLPFNKSNGLTTDTAWSMDIVGWNIVYMACTFPLYVAAVLLVDFPHILHAIGLKKAVVIDVNDQNPPSGDDDDVAAEAREVLYGRKGDVVSVKHLRKVYAASKGNRDPKVAVRDLTFGVKQNEIFAFLGTNGAGKTTTLSILSGDFSPTAGCTSVKGFDVVSQATEAKQEMGYCPQFDALIDLLTPKEHMAVYASLRGVPERLREKMCDTLLQVLDVSEYADVPCKALSGGNKRKTCIAISLMGGPSCVLLDEPTAGIDPVARRGLWTALQTVSAGRSVVLTTHHLEEVEALAHRTAIMVDGRLECLGTLGHLQQKFGGAYEIQVKVEPGSEEEVVAFFKGNAALSHASLIESTNHRLTYKVDSGVRLSALFRAIHRASSRVGISDYSITQTSLEQVFLAICKKHQGEV